MSIWVKCGISHLDALFTKNPRCGFLFIMYEKAAQRLWIRIPAHSTQTPNATFIAAYTLFGLLPNEVISPGMTKSAYRGAWF